MRLILVAITVLVALIILLFRYRKSQSIDLPLFIWATLTATLGLLSVGYFFATKNPHALIMASFVFLPLLPMHGLYRSVLSYFPFKEAAIFSLIMPITGLCLLAEIIENNIPLDINPSTINILTTLALIGAIYGALRALVQTRVSSLVSLLGISLFSIFWWFVLKSYSQLTTTSGEQLHGQIIFYALSVCLITAGLLLSWSYITSRYGDIEINKITDAIGGLYSTMPRFSVLFSLIIFSAMGLPPFGLFTGYIEMLLATTTTLNLEMWLVLLTILITTWYMIKLLQKVLFGPSKNNLLPSNSSTDITIQETLPLFLIVALLLLFGMADYESLINLVNIVR